MRASANTTLVHRIGAIAREKAALQARCDTIERAANGDATAVHIALVLGSALLEPTLRIANLLETQGRVPVVRWARDENLHIIGLELAVVQTVEEQAASATAPSDEMQVLA
jgi:hypothetical protein